ncbi:insulinase family protein [Gallaecimonas pentaromativorans]|uniref:Protease 3 n=1 Tax=Gallaecimonas pentaromativorans TaxID=584787 RepID=A0A3N1PZ94_9GAMM|nr:insulinase family protein [Gallaecimonas pentaromativorans]ROQ29896.1 secreted Zn-dependent insulinase-like peptidase [Gallaecimonas pentaromativorans]
MRKSPFDHRTYRHITLANGLPVLVVEDAKSHRAAAAVAVRVGHFFDPPHREGLAHFVEHLLFLGTDTHPGDGEYQSFIQRAGGYHNAWTGTEHSSYFFDVQPNHFSEALWRFSRFFVCPLLQPESVDNERHAIEAEYRLKLQDDTRRLYQVHKAVVNPEHPFSKFSVGNLETLAGDPVELASEARALYERHYHAGNMTLVLYGPQSVAELSSWAHSYFSDIRRGDKVPAFWEGTRLYQNLPFQVSAKPLKDQRRLAINFPLPSVQSEYRQKPLTFISHLLGHEGEGSLLAYLKDKNWVEALSAGGGISGSGFREYTVQFLLTPLGEQHQVEIVEALFAMLTLIRTEGLEGWRFAERQRLAEQSFRLMEVTEPMDYCSHLAVNLLQYPPDDVLYGDFVMSDFNPERIRYWLDFLTPDNLRLGLVSPDVEGEAEAPWYHTPFFTRPISKEWLSRWHSPALLPQLHLPTPNLFLGDAPEPAPLKQVKQRPDKVRESPHLRLWHWQDPDFRLPKGHLYLAMESPHAMASPKHIALTRLWLDMVSESLTGELYDAELAGLSWQLYPQQAGITLQLGGILGRQHRLFSHITQRLLDQPPPEHTLDMCRKALIRQYHSLKQQKPVQQLLAELTRLLQPSHPGYARLAREMEQLSFEDLVNHQQQVTQSLFVEGLVHGSAPREEVTPWLEEVFVRASGQEPVRKVLSLYQRGPLQRTYAVEHPDSALLVFYQGRSASAREHVFFMLAQQVMSATYFDELRNKQQLGYMLGVSFFPMQRLPGLLFYVQSPVAGPVQLLDAIDDFISDFSLLLLGLSQSQWQATQSALLHQLYQPDATLADRSSRLWHAIGQGDLTFDWRQRLAETVKNFSKTEFIKMMMKRLRAKAADRLLLASVGQQHRNLEPLEEGQFICDVSQFKSQSRLYKSA